MDKYELLDAIKNCDLEKVKALSASMTANELNSIKDNDNYSLLMCATKVNPSTLNFRTDNLDKADEIGVYLVEKKVSLDEQNNGHTAAFFATCFGHVETVKKLHKMGADFNKRTNYPLHLNPLEACMAESNYGMDEVHSEIALYLLQNKAVNDLNETNNFFGKNVLMLAIANGDMDVADYMVKNAKELSLDLTRTSRGGIDTALSLCQQNIENLEEDKPDEKSSRRAETWKTEMASWRKLRLSIKKAMRTQQNDAPQVVSSQQMVRQMDVQHTR